MWIHHIIMQKILIQIFTALNTWNLMCMKYNKSVNYLLFVALLSRLKCVNDDGLLKFSDFCINLWAFVMYAIDPQKIHLNQIFVVQYINLLNSIIGKSICLYSWLVLYINMCPWAKLLLEYTLIWFCYITLGL
jgi:hypothetical protein